MTELTSDQISDICATDPKLHPRHYSVYNRIARWVRCKKQCFESQIEMGRQLGLSERTVKRHIDALVSAGRIAYRQRPNSSNVYELLNDTGIPASELVHVKKGVQNHTDKMTGSHRHDDRQYKEPIEKNKIKLTGEVEKETEPATEPAKKVDKKTQELSYQDVVELFTTGNKDVQAIAAKHGITAIETVLKAFIKKWRHCSAYYSESLETWLSKLDGWFDKRKQLDVARETRKQAESRQPKKRYTFQELAMGLHLKEMPVKDRALELCQKFDALRLEAK